MTTVLVTRAAADGDPLAERLRTTGYGVRAIATMATRRLDVEWPDLAGYAWIVVTSAAGVESLPPGGAGPRWAVVGDGTAQALRARGISPDLIPGRASGAALAEAVPDAEGARILVVRGSLADPDLAEGLRARGAIVDELTTYETIEGPPDSREPLRAALAPGDVGAVVFASGSAVRGYLKLGGSASVPAITIGPRTTAVARSAGFVVLAEASRQTVADLVAAVERALPVEVGPDA
jgi:uroporphyrinogen-III synthase